MRHVSAFRSFALAGTALLLISSTVAAPASAATCTWGGGSGNWGVAGSWSCGVVPGSGDDVRIDNSTAISSAVSITSGQAVRNLTLDSGDALSISGAALSVYGGSVVAGGTITIGNSAQLIAYADTTVSGGGGIRLADVGAGAAYLYTANGTRMTIAAGTAVSGTGYFGANSGAYINNGTINANVSGAQSLYLDAQGGSAGLSGGGVGTGGNAGVLNTGLIEATGGGSLVIQQGYYENQGSGTILASGAGSTVTLTSDVRIVGGTLTSTGGGAINASSGTQYLQDVTLSSGSAINIGGDSIRLDGTLTNNGNVIVGSSANLIGEGATISIGGTGTITLKDVGSGAAYFYNDNGSRMTIGSGQTVTGTGYVGANSGAIVNNGVIAATAGAVGLNLDAQGGSGGLSGGGVGTGNNAGFLNNNTIEAIGGGKLNIAQGLYENGTNGLILASGTGSVVSLGSDVLIIGGTLTSTGGGAINAINSGTQYLQNVKLSTGSTLTMSGDTVRIDGTLTNNGTVSVGPSANLIGETTTSFLSGTGTITLSDVNTGAASLYNYNGTKMTIGAGQVVTGTGYVGQNSGVLINNGVITATAGVIGLNLDAQGGSGGIGSNLGVGFNTNSAFLNNNLLQASGGTLNFAQGLYDNGSSGKILASGAGSVINFGSDVLIIGGTITSAAGGTINAISSGTQYFQDVALTAGSRINVAGDTIRIDGTLTNNGTIALGTGGTLIGETAVSTIAGTGTITLTDVGAGAPYLYNFNGTKMTIGAGQTVSGTGYIGANSGVLTNNGVITAGFSSGGYALNIDAQGGSGGLGTNNGVGLDGNSAFLNNNLIQAVGGGLLNVAQGLYDNGSSGTILATGANSIVSFGSDVRILGGMLSSANGGAINAIGSGTQYLQDVTLGTGTGLFVRGDTMRIDNVLTNNGTISVGAGGTLIGETTASSFAGNGTILLQDASATLYDFNGTRMTIGQDQIVRGTGSIGVNSGAIINNGNILSDGAITIDSQGGSSGIGTAGVGTSGTVAFYNGATGQVQANNGGKTLALVQGTYENAGAFSVGTGSTFVMTGDANLVNLQTGGTLSGGGYFAFAGGTMTLRGSDAGVINTIGSTSGPATSVFLSGSGSTIQTLLSNGSTITAIDQSLQTIGATGTLTLAGGRSFTAVNGPFSNLGTLALQSGASFAATGGFTNSGTVTGNGTIGTPISNSGVVVADGGTLNSQAITGTTGTIQSNGGATLSLAGAGGASTAGFLTNNGTLALGNNSVTVTSDYKNANFTTAGGFNAHANVTGAGLILASSATQDLSGSGLNSATSTLNVGNVRLGGSSSTTLTITNNGTQTTLRGAVIAGSGATVSISGADFVVGPNGGSKTVTLSYSGTTAGSLAGQTVIVANNFDNVADQTLNLQGAAYRIAVASVTPNPVNLGAARVGGTLAGTVTIANTATADGFSEKLAVTGVTGSGSASGTAPSALIAAGGSATSAVSLDTSTSGIKSGSLVYQLATDGSGTSGLAQAAIGSATEAVNGIVTQLAVAQITNLSSLGSLSGGGGVYSLDLGTFSGNGQVTVDIGVLNAIANTAYAETLGGSFGGISDPGFSFTSTAFSGLTGGATDGGNLLTFDYSSLGNGNYNSALMLSVFSRYTGLSDLSLSPIRINVTANVNKATTPPSAVPEPVTWWTMILGFGFAGSALRRQRRQVRSATQPIAAD